MAKFRSTELYLPVNVVLKFISCGFVFLNFSIRHFTGLIIAVVQGGTILN